MSVMNSHLFTMCGETQNVGSDSEESDTQTASQYCSSSYSMVVPFEAIEIQRLETFQRERNHNSHGQNRNDTEDPRDNNDASQVFARGRVHQQRYQRLARA